MLTSAASADCPALQPYYPPHTPATPEEWSARLPALDAMLESCLRSAEFFALLGAAQLNTGQVSQALESLERALLLDPDNGAAQIDFAEGLFLSGQLFAALELNDTLLRRKDLPASLQPMLEARQRLWRERMQQHQFMVEATTGYDSNLNGAPSRSNLTLTFDGTPVILTLNEAYRPEAGAFANLRIGGNWQWLGPASQQDLLATVRFRKASVGDNDLIQGDWRYALVLPSRRAQWELSAGSSHMVYGGNALYSVGELKGRYVWGKSSCRPGVEVGVQQLHYHGQSIMDGRETSVVGGVTCGFVETRQQIRLDAGLLQNNSQHIGRPGGNRQGWSARVGWQWRVGEQELGVQWNHASLEDNQGYSPLLSNNAVRKIRSDYISLRYRKNLSQALGLSMSIGRQEQRSNLEPFRNRGTVGELGLALNF